MESLKVVYVIQKNTLNLCKTVWNNILFSITLNLETVQMIVFTI